jgi:archaellum component FlaC
MEDDFGGWLFGKDTGGATTSILGANYIPSELPGIGGFDPTSLPDFGGFSNFNTQFDNYVANQAPILLMAYDTNLPPSEALTQLRNQIPQILVQQDQIKELGQGLQSQSEKLQKDYKDYSSAYTDYQTKINNYNNFDAYAKSLGAQASNPMGVKYYPNSANGPVIVGPQVKSRGSYFPAWEIYKNGSTNTQGRWVATNYADVVRDATTNVTKLADTYKTDYTAFETAVNDLKTNVDTYKNSVNDVKTKTETITATPVTPTPEPPTVPSTTETPDTTGGTTGTTGGTTTGTDTTGVASGTDTTTDTTGTGTTGTVTTSGDVDTTGTTGTTGTTTDTTGTTGTTDTTVTPPTDQEIIDLITNPPITTPPTTPPVTPPVTEPTAPLEPVAPVTPDSTVDPMTVTPPPDALPVDEVPIDKLPVDKVPVDEEVVDETVKPPTKTVKDTPNVNLTILDIPNRRTLPANRALASSLNLNTNVGTVLGTGLSTRPDISSTSEPYLLESDNKKRRDVWNTESLRGALGI